MESMSRSTVAICSLILLSFLMGIFSSGSGAQAAPKAPFCDNSCQERKDFATLGGPKTTYYRLKYPDCVSCVGGKCVNPLFYPPKATCLPLSATAQSYDLYEFGEERCTAVAGTVEASNLANVKATVENQAWHTCWSTDARREIRR
jgi:hypothetical protein